MIGRRGPRNTGWWYPRTRTQQPIELAVGFEFIETSERGNDALTHLTAAAMAFDDLQLDAALRLLAAEVHVRLDRVRTD